MKEFGTEKYMWHFEHKDSQRPSQPSGDGRPSTHMGGRFEPSPRDFWRKKKGRSPEAAKQRTTPTILHGVGSAPRFV